MKQQHFVSPRISLLLILWSVLSGCGWLASIAVATERPNVVWLISEDNSIHYWKLFDEHGTETPRVAQLAKSGLLFSNAFSNAPVCSVARTTLMTGCFAPRIGTQFHRCAVTVPMPEGVRMFPAYLRDAGYYTTNNFKKDYNAIESEGTWDESSNSATWRDRQPGQPFFHMQSFKTTHESSLHFSQDVYKSKKTQTDPASVFVPPYFPDTELFRYTVARYHDNNQRVDMEFGQVIDQLAADGVLDDTFVFCFGDHGGVLPRGKGYAYESGLHVPLVVHVPKNFQNLSAWPSDSQIDGFVQFVDFGPTVLNLAGLPIPPGIDGQPFLGAGVTAENVDSQQTALGYADRFDEKYDLVRTLRKGQYEYVRSYQPFNFDGLQNNYRYIMLAYQQWREMYEAGELNDAQSQFFRQRPAEMLFDISNDPHEVINLSDDPAYAAVLESLRGELQSQVKSMPDLSFYPESHLATQAFDNPTEFGQTHSEEIAALVDLADLSLQPFEAVRQQLENALQSDLPTHRYWALITCSTFGEAATPLAEEAKKLAASDTDLLVRTRAAEFLGLIQFEDPRPVIMNCLAESESGIEINLILNTATLLNDLPLGYKFSIDLDSVNPKAADFTDVRRRIAYFEADGQQPDNPQGKKPGKAKVAK